MASSNLFVANDMLAAQYVKHPNRPGEKAVGILVQDKQGTDALWVLEESSVVDLIVLLSGGISESSIQILTELAKTDIVSSWAREERESDGQAVVRLVLYGHVEAEIPEYQADSAIEMLSTVLHAQGHAQLGD